jgi:hypothetical protein
MLEMICTEFMLISLSVTERPDTLESLSVGDDMY